MTAQMATMLSSGWRIMAISPSKGFMGTYWEQETHWQLAMLLKSSGNGAPYFYIVSICMFTLSASVICIR